MQSTYPRYDRRSIRLQNYDYTQNGAYFITICTHNRECVFGSVINGQMQLNEEGKIAELCWQHIPQHFPQSTLDEFVVMPNHIHGLIILDNSATLIRDQPAVPLLAHEQFSKPVSGSIPTIVRSYKSAVTKQINALWQTPSHTFWQRNYYEHIVRNLTEMEKIHRYIANNPASWALNPDNDARW